ncbi:MAG TPA: hypothetical protein VKF15_03455 [Nitrososphaerales archaeon]|nr:hypothetical protein [Nitrososphaerales archaeon]
METKERRPDAALPPDAQRSSPLRHSRKSAALAALLTAAAVYLLFDFFWPGIILGVLLLLLAVALSTFAYRYRAVVAALPKPQGRGRVSVMDAERARTQGLLIVALGVATLFVPFIALYFLPAAAVVAFVLALMGGLAASELLYFAWVTWFQRKTRSTILSFTEFRDEEGRQRLVKSLEMEPWDEKA